MGEKDFERSVSRFAKHLLCNNHWARLSYSFRVVTINYHRGGGLNDLHLFFSPGAAKAEIRVSADLVSGETFFPVMRSHSLCLVTAGREQETSCLTLSLQGH